MQKKHKFGGAKVCKAEKVRKHFVNPKIEKEVFGQYINYIFVVWILRNTEALLRRRTSEKVSLKISQCSQENTCV